MGPATYNYRAHFPERQLLARVSRAERIGLGKYGRTSFEFDGIDVSSVNVDIDELMSPRLIKPFALLRVVTTERRFARLFDVVPQIGDWFLLSLVPPTASKNVLRKRLPCWHAQLTEAGYTEQSKGYTAHAEFLLKDDEPPTFPLGASVAHSAERKFVRSLNFPIGAVVPTEVVRKFLARIQKPQSVLVRDVGQASFISLLDRNGKALLHYDVGWPISFNGRTVGKRKPLACGDAPILLSHWDWDHLHGFYKFANLKNQIWIAPVQSLGPGARKIASQLNASQKLMGYNGRPVRVSLGKLTVCRGPRGNCNQTGIALLVSLANRKKVLLVGDADYQYADVTQRLDGLVVTHHGAEFSGPVPRPTKKRNTCVVSVGKYNVYRHPRASAISKHRNMGWNSIATATLWRLRRGDRTIV